MKNSRHIQNLLKITFIIFSFGILQSCQNEDGEILQSSKDLDATTNTYLNDELNNSNPNENFLKDLDIPTVTITKGLSIANPLTSYRITPLKIKDRRLELFYFIGQQFEDRWFFNKYYSNFYAGYRGYVPRSIKRLISVPFDDGFNDGGGLSTPILLKFRALPNKSYRLRFKVENEQLKNRRIVVGIGSNLVYVKLNKQNEIIYVFETDKIQRIEPLKIALGLYGAQGRELPWRSLLEVKEIRIDEI